MSERELFYATCLNKSVIKAVTGLIYMLTGIVHSILN